MSDPFVGLEFDPANTKFEKVPKSEYTKTHEVDGPWWLFAKYCDGEGTKRCYIVISGFLRQKRDTEPETYGEPEPDFGTVFLIENGNYKILGVADRLEGDDLHIGDPAIIRGLMDDAARRLIDAFGGSAVVQQKVEQMPRHPWMIPVMAEALERAGVHVPREMILYGPDVPWMAKPKAPK